MVFPLLPPLEPALRLCKSLEEVESAARQEQGWTIRLVHPNRMIWYEMMGQGLADKVARYTGALGSGGHSFPREYGYAGALLKLREKLDQGFKAVEYGHTSHRAPKAIDPLVFVEFVQLVDGRWQGNDKEGNFLVDLPLETVLSLAEEASIQLDLQSQEPQALR